ncbi:MAG: 50S ribosomal protein L15 [Deltaproteobacteria bacterium RIFCSPHIGHO2_12_FULL_43_9]|nr:MAG: 50S ribosomal protein L15 [Deltaproteobacteria bacterium RIFCSPHIGHO2_12_FULL_43_9]
MKLNTIAPSSGSTHYRKRVGRGNGSGHGTTAGRGCKGAGSRTGATSDPRFEGGQMPLYRRLPKVGFTNIFRKQFLPVNLNLLNKFSKGSIVDPAMLRSSGIIKNGKIWIKILGNGELKHALNIKAHAFSESAKKKIEAVGGTAEVLGESWQQA